MLSTGTLIIISGIFKMIGILITIFLIYNSKIVRKIVNERSIVIAVLCMVLFGFVWWVFLWMIYETVSAIREDEDKKRYI